jgi:hypothetical protein
MDKVTNARRGWRLVVAAAALAAVTAGCGTEDELPGQDINKPTVETTTEQNVPTPSIDTRKCADSAAQARAEHRSLCVD